MNTSLLKPLSAHIRALCWVGFSAAAMFSLSSCGQNQAAPTAQTDETHEVAAKGLVDDDHAGEAVAQITQVDEATKKYSPYAGNGKVPDADPVVAKSILTTSTGDFPTRPLFGDTHLHTMNSGDAFAAGARLGPEEAYKFARGEEVVSSTGVPIKLSRPLDFVVVADHAEGLGLMAQVFEGNPAFASDPKLQAWQAGMKKGGDVAAAVQTEIVSSQANGTLPAPIKDPKVVGPIMKTVWQQSLVTADKYNEPGKFTAMLGYEWTSVPKGNNLHRNVIFRDNRDKVSQIMPFSAWQSEDPEKLWDWMAKYEEKTGGQVLDIAHNANLSNGRMFEPTNFTGMPMSKEYAEKRAKYDVLQEMTQTKGTSETNPLISPNDEFANFGVAGWEYGNLTLEGSPLTKDMMPTTYLRSGLLQGLLHEAKLGVNPFKFGLIGGTDVHNGLTAVEENNYAGKMPIQEPSAKRWGHVSKQGLGKTRYTWHYEAASWAAVWAKDNSRESIWDAMKRKETYVTSGPRMTVRMFAGWDFTAADAKSPDMVKLGYTKGVPMGGDLKTTVGKKAPTFIVAALKDSIGGNLDRVQIVKGWVDKAGKTHEKIYDVVWGDAEKRKMVKGKLTPVGDTVDVATATWTNTIGDPELIGFWKDPNFDPSIRAFYYTRVLEIPTPRWTAYDQLRFGIKMSPEVPMKHQERAWTSPIWYTPV